ncbi:tRNA (adenosine(37)-N6)-threonylcarbamoyltransferase complex dimerization subunit type 1 TsaB [Thermaurantiacus sp.]
MPDPLGAGEPTLVIATGHDLSIALVSGDTVLAEAHEARARGHAEALVPAVRALLGGRVEPRRILVERGPGSFTGLRVGIAAARALGIAWGVPVLGVGSTDLVAAEARANGAAFPLGVALLAPRGEVWFEAFGPEGSLGGPVALAAAELPAHAARFGGALTGSAAVALGLGGPETTPRAASARRLGSTALGPPEPCYIRPAPLATEVA